ncbi:hypothetical protein KUCAC02_005938, partial [Chaenocephalus aceratus]
MRKWLFLCYNCFLSDEELSASHRLFLFLLSLATVLLKFQTDKGRDPDPLSYPEDSQLLRQIREDVLEALAVSSDLLNDDFISYCFSEMSPVCAVVGGVLGQEVVK